MGLSSSQARLLMLTSRLSDIQLQQMMNAQEKGQLAWQSQEVAKEYNDAMSNYKLTIKVTDYDEKFGYRKENLNYNNLTQMGYVVTGPDGEIYLPKKDGEWSWPVDAEGNSLMPKVETEAQLAFETQLFDLYHQLENASDEEAKNKVLEDIEKLKEEYYTNMSNNPQDYGYQIKDGSEFLNNPTILQSLIINGKLFLNKVDEETGSMTMDMLASDTNIEYVLDTSDDAEAESKYQYETACLARKQSQLDLELDQLETQHNAVIKEIDSVKEVIGNNIDRTYNLFSSKG